MARASKRKGTTIKYGRDERRDVRRVARLNGQALGTWVREQTVLLARRRLRKLQAKAASEGLAR